MATILGAGFFQAAAWCPSPVATSLPQARALPHEATPAEEPADELLARVTSALAGLRGGLTLAELRARVPEPVGAIRRAIAAGLRARQLRRVGAHHGLRYVLNAQ